MGHRGRTVSKAYDRAMAFLEEADEEEGEEAAPYRGKCWRCLKGDPRLKGSDYACEPCYLWMIGESDHDPREIIKNKTTTAHGAAPLPWWWGRRTEDG